MIVANLKKLSGEGPELIQFELGTYTLKAVVGPHPRTHLFFTCTRNRVNYFKFRFRNHQVYTLSSWVTLTNGQIMQLGKSRYQYHWMLLTPQPITPAIVKHLTISLNQQQASAFFSLMHKLPPSVIADQLKGPNLKFKHTPQLEHWLTQNEIGLEIIE